MNYFQMEQQAKEHREQLMNEASAWRLEQTALRASGNRPGWFSQKMVTLGTWMVSTGENLRKRYEYIPSPQPADCSLSG